MRTPWIGGYPMRPQPIWRTTLFGVLCLALLLPHAVRAQPATHTIFVNAVEYKGSTTTEQRAPPQVNPTTLSQGDASKGPGEADHTAPQQWEVESDACAPGFVTVQQGDAVAVHAFVVHGDQHDVSVLAPDGQVVVPPSTWTRGGAYQLSFKAEKVGTYTVDDGEHCRLAAVACVCGLWRERAPGVSRETHTSRLTLESLMTLYGL